MVGSVAIACLGRVLRDVTLLATCDAPFRGSRSSGVAAIVCQKSLNLADAVGRDAETVCCTAFGGRFMAGYGASLSTHFAGSNLRLPIKSPRRG